MLIILFGTPGVGKNYVGRILQDEFDYFFYDADEDLTEDMKASIQKGELFTEQMRVDFFNIVAEKIALLQKKNRCVVVTQALMKEKNRLQLQQKYPQAQFILIEAEEDIIDDRLRQRNDWVSLEFANKVRQGFEKPVVQYTTFYNNAGFEEIISQFELFSKSIEK